MCKDLPENICSLRFCSLQGKHRAWEVGDHAKVQQIDVIEAVGTSIVGFHFPGDFVFRKSYNYDKSRSIWATLSDTWCESWHCPVQGQELSQ